MGFVMKKLFAAVLFLLAMPLTAQTLAKPALPGWMAGTWVMEDGATWADEVWTDPRGGIMLGMARTGFGPDLQGWEVTQIKVKADGTISFFAQPNGKPPSSRLNSPTRRTITRSGSAIGGKASC
jgi:Domain of unknown function (DUF6265)